MRTAETQCCRSRAPTSGVWSRAESPAHNMSDSIVRRGQPQQETAITCSALGARSSGSMNHSGYCIAQSVDRTCSALNRPPVSCNMQHMSAVQLA